MRGRKATTAAAATPAAATRANPARVVQWCEPAAEKDDPDQSGAKNPLDRVRELFTITKDIHLIRWLCNEAEGFYVADPDLEVRKSHDQAIYAETLGFHSAWIGEHHFSSLGVNSSPEILLTYVAAKTRRIRLAPAVTVRLLTPVARAAAMAAAKSLFNAIFIPSR